jgi:transcriptional regulator with XRE-family HTH domain
VHEWEAGNTSPSAVDVVGLADIYGVSLDWLLARDADTTFLGLIDENALGRLMSAKNAKEAYRALPQVAVKISDQVRAVHDLEEFAVQIRRAHDAIIEIERRRGRE